MNRIVKLVGLVLAELDDRIYVAQRFGEKTGTQAQSKNRRIAGFEVIAVVDADLGSAVTLHALLPIYDVAMEGILHMRLAIGGPRAKYTRRVRFVVGEKHLATEGSVEVIVAQGVGRLQVRDRRRSGFIGQ